MVRFYDASNAEEQERVEMLLRGAGIEYFLREVSGGMGPAEILLAEEDLPRAEEILARAGRPSYH
ncbi:putative signal transducing protein [Geoalkalibacter sp.]|uniref:putative signal transducing protein n=1 Tax=Geoalkalibacter sp. TaxID=3041440 RepID=UPI00272E1B1B|nr:DUF2007 domain-containing protein [Geoalkalibacter sp.]